MLAGIGGTLLFSIHSITGASKILETKGLLHRSRNSNKNYFKFHAYIQNKYFNKCNETLDAR